MMDSEKLLEITGLSVRYPNRTKDTLRDISLTLHRGEITCVIGESGCGKSTLLNAIMQLPGKVEISGGSVAFKGKEIKTLNKRELQQLRGSGIGVVFQEPGASLNPIRKIHIQFYEAMRAHEHITKAEARTRAAEILESLEFKEPDRILDSYPVQLSGGMNQRVAIALAMALKPDILLADEPTSALDVTVQAQIVEELISLRNHFHTCILLITHNMGVVAKMADKVAVMYGGRMIEYGKRDQLLKCPAHPYTKALLEAIPKLSGEQPKGIPGKRPDEFQETGCAFASRCRYVKDSCHKDAQKPIDLEPDHWALCGEVYAWKNRY